jgi:CheY-like chemotaxis protein
VEGVTVIVVDDEEASRGQLLGALRRLGLRAVAVASMEDAVALLEALSADVTLVHGAGDGATLARLRRRSRLVQLPRGAALEETVVRLLRALGRPEAAALIN